MSEVKIVRLQTGEEIICKCKIDSKKGTVNMKKAAIIIPVGQGQIGLSPFMPYTDTSDGVTVKDRHIMFIVSPVKEFLKEYDAGFGSGLVVAGANDIVEAGAGIPNLKITE